MRCLEGTNGSDSGFNTAIADTSLEKRWNCSATMLLAARQVAWAGLIIAAIFFLVCPLSTVAQTTPTLSVATSNTPSAYGNAVTFTATVSSGPVGSITFYDGTTSIGTGTISGTAATLSTSSLSIGVHTITAKWLGNANYSAVTSGSLTETIRNATTTTLAVSSNSPAAGSAVTLTATVKMGTTAVYPGLVLFCDASASRCADMAVIGSAQLSSAGSAATTLRFGAGTHKVKAIFMGKTSYQTSISSTQSITASQSGTFATTTNLGVTGSASNYVMSGSVIASGVSLLSGTISFLDTSNSNSQIGSATLGTPKYTLQSPTLYADNNTSCYEANCIAIAADVDGNGIPDILSANYSSNIVSVSLGNGDGSFQSPVSYSTGTTPLSLAIADFNADGIPDLVASNNASNNVSIMLGNGDGTFKPQVTYPVSQNPDGVAVGDFNGDGNADLLVVTGYNTLSVLLGNGDGTFQPQITTPSVDHAPFAVVVADFDGDGNLDAAVTINYGTAQNSEIGIFLGNGDGTFQAPYLYSPAGSVTIAIADFDLDGIPDLVYSDHNNSFLSVMLGNGDGTFDAAVQYPAGTLVGSVAVGDFNLDGIPDLVTPDQAGTTTVLLGIGDGSFQTPLTFATPGFGAGVAVSDLNGDGLPDIVTTVGQLSVQLNSQVASYNATGVSFTGAEGQHNILAKYAGNTAYAASQSNTVSLTSYNTTPSLSVATSAASVNYGGSVYFYGDHFQRTSWVGEFLRRKHIDRKWNDRVAESRLSPPPH